MNNKLFTVAIKYKQDGKTYLFATRSPSKETLEKTLQKVCRVVNVGGEKVEVVPLGIYDGLIKGVSRFRCGDPVTQDHIDEAMAQGRYLYFYDGGKVSVVKDCDTIGTVSYREFAEACSILAVVQKAIPKDIDTNPRGESTGINFKDGKVYLKRLFGQGVRIEVDPRQPMRAWDLLLDSLNKKEAYDEEAKLLKQIATLEEQVAHLKGKLKRPVAC